MLMLFSGQVIPSIIYYFLKRPDQPGDSSALNLLSTPFLDFNLLQPFLEAWNKQIATVWVCQLLCHTCAQRSQGRVEITCCLLRPPTILINASLCLGSAWQARKKPSFCIQEFHQHIYLSFLNLFVVVKIPPTHKPPKSSQQDSPPFSTSDVHQRPWPFCCRSFSDLLHTSHLRPFRTSPQPSRLAEGGLFNGFSL